MTTRAQILIVIVAILGAAVILWLVRRGSLKERFALLWLAIAAGLIGLVAGSLRLLGFGNDQVTVAQTA